MTPGNITQTVPAAVATTKAPVPLTGTATFGGNVTAALTKVVTADLEAHGPGEFAGPGVVLTISVVNGSAKAVDLSSVGVTVVGTNKVAALPVQSGSGLPFSGQLAPGRTATASYAFSLHSLPSNPVTVSIDYSAAAPVVAFTGNIS